MQVFFILALGELRSFLVKLKIVTKGEFNNVSAQSAI